MMALAISDPDCIMCGECMEACPTGAVDLAEGVIHDDMCIDCGACKEVCPNDAIFEPLYS